MDDIIPSSNMLGYTHQFKLMHINTHLSIMLGYTHQLMHINTQSIFIRWPSCLAYSALFVPKVKYAYPHFSAHAMMTSFCYQEDGMCA